MRKKVSSIDDATPSDWDATAKKAASYTDPYDMPPSKDSVNHPPHYNYGKIECIDYLEDNLKDGFPAYLDGNIKKYLHRWRYKKRPVEDLRKARWYLDKLIETMIK